jgi:elongation factor G
MFIQWTEANLQKLDIPESEKSKADELHNVLVEKAAENDEHLMELFFEKGSLDEDELRKGLHIGMLNHDVFPVLCLSALKNMGSGRLMGFIDNVAPAAHQLYAEITEDGQSQLPMLSMARPFFLFLGQNMNRIWESSLISKFSVVN